MSETLMIFGLFLLVGLVGLAWIGRRRMAFYEDFQGRKRRSEAAMKSGEEFKRDR